MTREPLRIDVSFIELCVEEFKSSERKVVTNNIQDTVSIIGIDGLMMNVKSQPI